MELKNFSDYFFEHLASGNAPGVLPISSACNAQCLFCSNHTNPFEIMRVKHRPLEEIEKVIWAMDGSYRGEFLLNEAITGKLSEGEIFTHPKAFDILACIRSKFKKNAIVVSTNGSLLTEDKIKRLADFMPIKVPFSIHSFNRGHWKAIFKLKDKHYDTAIRSFGILKEHSIPVAPRVIAMPALVGYDDLEHTLSELKRRGFNFVGLTHASWTRYTKPDIVDQLKIDRRELADFCDRMSVKWDMKVSYTEHPDKPMTFTVDKFKRIMRKHPDRKIYWLVSTAAYSKIKPVLEGLGEQNIVLEVPNYTYGGNITCAGLWSIKDVDRVIKEHGLKNEVIYLRGRFVNKYGYDLMGDNIVDYLKTAENEINLVQQI